MEVFELLKVFGPLGVLVWVVWWVFTRMIPGILRSHSTSLDKACTDFRTTLADQRADFVRELGAQRQLTEAVVQACPHAVVKREDLRTVGVERRVS